jgi:hypothetical protein
VLCLPGASSNGAKVFWFFFSKKNGFLTQAARDAIHDELAADMKRLEDTAKKDTQSDHP